MIYFHLQDQKRWPISTKKHIRLVMRFENVSRSWKQDAKVPGNKDGGA